MSPYKIWIIVGTLNFLPPHGGFGVPLWVDYLIGFVCVCVAVSYAPPYDASKRKEKP